MGRLIDADALTAIIKKHKEFTEEMKGLSTAGYKLALDHIEEVVELLAIYASEICNNGWIPCEDRLPDYYDNVLVCTKDGGRTIAHLTHSPIEWKDIHNYKIENIIAWMPLPAPYKKGEQ